MKDQDNSSADSSAATLLDLVNLLNELFDKNDLITAEKVSCRLTRQFGDHYVTWYIRAIVLRLTNRPKEALLAVYHSIWLHETSDALAELACIWEILEPHHKADQLPGVITDSQELHKALALRFCRELDANAYKRVYFEISGICNAKCPYCVTGINCINGRNIEEIRARKFVDVDEFEFTINHLIANSIISRRESVIQLYNWGEPCLHPHFEKLLSILTENGIRYGFSTNCSVFKELPPSVLTNLNNVIFSMPGFSRDSYNRIHGFDFEKIKQNITKMVMLWRKSGYKGNFVIAYHVYQFNILECEAAANFARELGIGISFAHAGLNGYALMKSYLDDTMSREALKKCSSELIMYFYKDIKRPKDHRCEQFDFLTINEHCELLPCCGVERGMPLYSLGRINEMSLEQIKDKKLNAKYCKKCAEIGMDYIGEAIFRQPFGRF